MSSTPTALQNSSGNETPRPSLFERTVPQSQATSYATESKPPVQSSTQKFDTNILKKILEVTSEDNLEETLINDIKEHKNGIITQEKSYGIVFRLTQLNNVLKDIFELKSQNKTDDNDAIIKLLDLAIILTVKRIQSFVVSVSSVVLNHKNADFSQKLKRISKCLLLKQLQELTSLFCKYCHLISEEIMLAVLLTHTFTQVPYPEEHKENIYIFLATGTSPMGHLIHMQNGPHIWQRIIETDMLSSIKSETTLSSALQKIADRVSFWNNLFLNLDDTQKHIRLNVYESAAEIAKMLPDLYP